MSEQLWGQAGPAAWEEIHQLIVYFHKEPLSPSPSTGWDREHSQATSGGNAGA